MITRSVKIGKRSGDAGEAVFVLFDYAGGRELARRPSLFLAERLATNMGWRVLEKPTESIELPERVR